MRLASVFVVLAALYVALAGCGGDNLQLCGGCTTPTPTPTGTPVATATTATPSATPSPTATNTP